MIVRPLLALLCCVGLSAQQTPTGMEEEPSAPSRWKLKLGAMLLDHPRYPGSGEQRITPLPVIHVEYADRFFLGSSRIGVGLGGGVHAFKNERWTWDIGLGLGESRKENRADVLAGLGNRSISAWAGTGLHLRTGLFRASLQVASALNQDGGAKGTLSLGLGGRVAERFFGGLQLSATASDAKNMAFDFGVTPEQALTRTALIASGDARLRQGEGRAYAPKAGIQDLALGANLTYVADLHWRWFGVLRVSQLQSEAKASPLVRQATNLSVGAGFAYRF
jgi:outer membrane scaffolding protein for murein synthesis (MipA/OmpV family)